MDETNLDKIAHIRTEYGARALREAAVDKDPIIQFRTWFDEALAADVVEPTAMTLATTNSEGYPSARIVLLKSVDHRGFVFYTNYESRKARELSVNPHAALVLLWATLHRQVRIEGIVEVVSPEESDLYFATRPRGSQLGAWASSQSSVITDRAILEERLYELEREYAGQTIPRPALWGGFRLRPASIEFWQGRESRLHDRLRYSADATGCWGIDRLAP